MSLSLILTHVAKTPEETRCGLVVPPPNDAKPIVAGARVGIILGRYVQSSYVTGERDSNEECLKCKKS